MSMKSRLEKLERSVKSEKRPGFGIAIQNPGDGSFQLDGKTYKSRDDLPKGVYKPLIVVLIGKRRSE